jgi:type IV pilus assembly protein PilA
MRQSGSCHRLAVIFCSCGSTTVLSPRVCVLRHPKGFTLIELLIVMGIIGVLAAIAIPKFSSVKQKAYRSQAISDLTNLRTAEETFFADSGHYGSLTQLGATYSKTPGIVITTLIDTPLSWSATLIHTQLPNTVCGIAVAVTNPVDPIAGEGEPICK